MNDTSSDDILLLKQRLAEQEALIHVLQEKLKPAGSCFPECGGSLSYLGEDTAEQLELMRSAFRVIRTVREKHACTKFDAIVQAPAPSRPIERGIAGQIARWSFDKGQPAGAGTDTPQPCHIKFYPCVPKSGRSGY